MTDRKKPGMAFWATVVLVAVLLYTFAFGPAVWLTARGALSETIVKSLYWPFLCQRVHLRNFWGAVLGWYGSAGIPSGTVVVITTDDLEGDTISATFGGAVPKQAN